jgi:hypothetical protein
VVDWVFCVGLLDYEHEQQHRFTEHEHRFTEHERDIGYRMLEC